MVNKNETQQGNKNIGEEFSLDLDDIDTLSLEDSNDVPSSESSIEGENKLQVQKTTEENGINKGDSMFANVSEIDTLETPIVQENSTSNEFIGEGANESVSVNIDLSYKKKKRGDSADIYAKRSRVIKIFRVVFLLLSIFLLGYFKYQKYFAFVEQKDIIDQEKVQRSKNYIQKARDIRTKVDEYIPVDVSKKYKDTTVLNDFDVIVQAGDIGYIDKKYLLNNKMVDFMDTLRNEKGILDDKKQNITKYAYFPKDISRIIGQDDDINSIEDSLFALEAIKFNSAVNVFMYLDSFVRNLSKSAYISKDEIKKSMKYISDEGGKDINLYIKKCYLNPFETNYECNVIGDYDRYFKLFESGEHAIDGKFFKKMMYYVDLKLERTELPSFNITFQKFNNHNEKITFTIDINTLKQDELELQNAGILVDPVVFIMDKLINNLKRSRFIKGNDIKVDSLKIKTKKVKVGVTEFLVSTISKVFELPIQKDIEREIYDFVDTTS